MDIFFERNVDTGILSSDCNINLSITLAESLFGCIIQGHDVFMSVDWRLK